MFQYKNTFSPKEVVYLYFVKKKLLANEEVKFDFVHPVMQKE